MKRTFIILASLLTLAFTGCIEDTFAPDSVKTPESVTPSNLQYATLKNAREYASFKTGVPTVDTDNVIPTFEIVGGRDQNGTALTPEALAYATIENPIQNESIVEDTGDVVITWDYQTAGQINVGLGHPFVAQNEYSFDIKVTTEYQGVEYSTVFTDGYKFSVIPSMPTASMAMYLPLAQNLSLDVAGDISTTPIFSQFGDNLIFKLTEEDDAIFDINEKGQFSLDANYVYPSPAPAEGYVIYHPSIVAVNTISNEEVTLEGSANLVTIYVSETDITDQMPQQTKYFLVPDFNSKTSTDFKVYVPLQGAAKNTFFPSGSTFKIKDSWLFKCKTEDMYPQEILGAPTARNCGLTNATTPEPAEAWMILSGQDFTQFKLGFDVFAVFHMQGAYNEYCEDGTSLSNIQAYYSTDFDQFATDAPDMSAATWTAVGDPDNGTLDFTKLTIYSNIGKATEVPYMPYPGDQHLLSEKFPEMVDPFADIKNMTYNWEINNVLRVEMKLTDFVNEPNFTLAFKVTCKQATGSGGAVNFTSPGRPGNYYLGGVYMYAKEQAPAAE